MTHHVKESLEDMSSDTVISQQETNDLKSGNTSQRISIDSVNLALSIKVKKTKIFISVLTMKNDNLDKRRKEVNFWKENIRLKNLVSLKTRT